MKSSFLVAFSNEDLRLLIVLQLAICRKISVFYLCSICLATKKACDFSSSILWQKKYIGAGPSHVLKHFLQGLICNIHLYSID